MLKFLDPYLPVIYGLAIVAALGGIWGYGHHRYNAGYADAKAKAAEQVATERVSEFLRQGRANAAATASALETITMLDLSNEALTAKLKENKDAAARDPDADRECLSVDGVRRLNAIR